MCFLLISWGSVGKRRLKNTHDQKDHVINRSHTWDKVEFRKVAYVFLMLAVQILLKILLLYILTFCVLFLWLLLLLTLNLKGQFGLCLVGCMMYILIVSVLLVVDTHSSCSTETIRVCSDQDYVKPRPTSKETLYSPFHFEYCNTHTPIYIVYPSVFKVAKICVAANPVHSSTLLRVYNKNLFWRSSVCHALDTWQ